MTRSIALTAVLSALLTASLLVVPAPVAAADPVLVGAGDISDCGSAKDEETATLLDDIPGTVVTLGDNAYTSGSAAQYRDCYDPTWGRHKSRTKPSAATTSTRRRARRATSAISGQPRARPGRAGTATTWGAGT